MPAAADLLPPGCVQAKCPQATPGIANSFDFQDTAAGKLNMIMYHNDTTRIGGGNGGGPGATQRVVKPVDSAINSWLQDWLGTPAKTN